MRISLFLPFSWLLHRRCCIFSESRRSKEMLNYLLEVIQRPWQSTEWREYCWIANLRLLPNRPWRFYPVPSRNGSLYIVGWEGSAVRAFVFLNHRDDYQELHLCDAHFYHSGQVRNGLHWLSGWVKSVKLPSTGVEEFGKKIIPWLTST